MVQTNQQLSLSAVLPRHGGCMLCLTASSPDNDPAHHQCAWAQAALALEAERPQTAAAPTPAGCCTKTRLGLRRWAAQDGYLRRDWPRRAGWQTQSPAHVRPHGDPHEQYLINVHRPKPTRLFVPSAASYSWTLLYRPPYCRRISRSCRTLQPKGTAWARHRYAMHPGVHFRHLAVQQALQGEHTRSTHDLHILQGTKEKPVAWRP